MRARDLRNSILQLAVEGGLVPQDATEEPASELVARIRDERRRLVAAGKAKVPKGGESVICRGEDGSWYERRGKGEPRRIDSEIPFDIPEGWEWARLSTIAAVLNGDRGKYYPAKSKLINSGIPFVSALNISHRLVVEDQMLYMTESQFDALRAGKLEMNDIVFCIRGSLGKFGVFPFEKGAIASSLVIVRPLLKDMDLLSFLNLLLDSPVTTSLIMKYNNGTAQPNMSARNFESFLLPIPSLGEQRRIVAKVDELMPLVGEYGRLEEEREKLDSELPGRLRKSVLQLAVEGRLVPQDATEEPASELMARIRDERRRLVAAGKAKAPKGGESIIYRGEDSSWYERRGKGEPRCIDGEIPFDIPEGWEWARLGAICVLARGNGIKRCETTKDGLPCIRYGELYTTYSVAIEKVVSHTSEAVYNASHKLEPNSVLMTLTGENDIDIGKAAANRTTEALAYGGDLLGLGSDAMYGSFLAMVINGPYIQKQRTTKATGKIIVHLSVDKVSDFLVAVPPLAEQQRIIAKVDELMPLVEEYGRLEEDHVGGQEC